MQSSFSSSRLAVAAALLLVVLGAATSAHARSDVTFSIGIQVPGVYVQPAPVYAPPPRVFYQPAPVYTPPQRVYYQPQPVYVQPVPVYVHPRPVFVQPPAYGVYYRSGPDWHQNQWERARKHGHRDHDRKHGRNHD